MLKMQVDVKRMKKAALRPPLVLNGQSLSPLKAISRFRRLTKML